MERVAEVAAAVSAALTAAGYVQVEVSARHIHVNRAHMQALFGEELVEKRALSQPGQYLSEQRVTLIGPKGSMERVAVLGPARGNTQIELSVTDAVHLGVKPPVRESGDVAGSAGLVIQGPKGRVELASGVIIAKRHVHVTPGVAATLGLRDKQIVSVRMLSERPVTFHDVLVRVSDKFRFRMHVDFDEAGAARIEGFTLGQIIV